MSNKDYIGDSMKTDYIRKHKLIQNVETREITDHGSINAAKRESRRLQSVGCVVRVGGLLPRKSEVEQ